MTTNPTSALHRYTALDPVRQTIGDVYAQVRADLLDHPNYRLDVFPPGTPGTARRRTGLGGRHRLRGDRRAHRVRLREHRRPR